MAILPSRTLWVWERPEDLRGVDVRTTAIVFLDRTILVGQEAISVPRRQPLSYPSGIRRIAVVRIQVVPGARLDSGMGDQIKAQLLESSRQTGVDALQVDFDATRSQRRFYSRLLTGLRNEMPASLPLSITALASWCSYDDWIGDLPIDEAVPMFFRMEPDRRHAPGYRTQFRIREPKCKGSAGVSTREPWPDGLVGKRIYVFADRGWREDFPLLAERKLP
jgi:hypothetical protein